MSDQSKFEDKIDEIKLSLEKVLHQKLDEVIQTLVFEKGVICWLTVDEVTQRKYNMSSRNIRLSKNSIKSMGIDRNDDSKYLIDLSLNGQPTILSTDIRVLNGAILDHGDDSECYYIAKIIYSMIESAIHNTIFSSEEDVEEDTPMVDETVKMDVGVNVVEADFLRKKVIKKETLH